MPVPYFRNIVLLSVVMNGCGTTAPPSSPNVLLISLDTFRADVMGVYGNTMGLTPYFDQLAQESYVFDNAYTVTPLTIPAHASLHTGLIPPHHGVRDNGASKLNASYDTVAEQFKRRGYTTMAVVSADVTGRTWGFAQGFDSFSDALGRDALGAPKRERRASEVLQEFIDWRGMHDSGPWFGWLHFFDAHYPYAPPQPYQTQYESVPYFGEIAYLDATIGRWLVEEREQGRLKETWIVILADHGEGLGEHGEWSHGALLNNGTMRIPLLIVPPDSGKGVRVQDVTSIVDIAPTVLALTGEAAREPVDGVNLIPVFSGGAHETHPAYMESQYAHRHFGWAPMSGVVEGTFKLLVSTQARLFRLADRKESHDVSEVHPEQVTALQATLNAMVDDTRLRNASVSLPESLQQEQLQALGYLTEVADPVPVSVQQDPVAMIDTLEEFERLRAAHQEGTASIDALATFLKEHPQISTVRLMLADALLTAREPTRVLALLGKQSPTPSTTTRMANAHLMMGERAVAMQQVEATLLLYPNASSLGALKLKLLWVERQRDALGQYAAEAIKQWPDDPEILCWVGISRWKNGQSMDAQRVLQRALELDPRQPYCRTTLAEIKWSSAEAEGLLKDEIRLFPPAVEARLHLVRWYGERKRFEEQINMLQALRVAQPDNHLLHHSEGQALFNLGKYLEAEAIVNECIALSPQYIPCLVLQANVFDKQGKKEPAHQMMERARAIGRKR